MTSEQSARRTGCRATVVYEPGARYPWRPQCTCNERFSGYVAEHVALCRWGGLLSTSRPPFVSASRPSRCGP